MSTILEALRKSERARRRRQAPVYRDASSQDAPAVLRWLALTAGLVLLVALGLSAWLMARSPVDVTVAEPPSVQDSPVGATAPVVTKPPAADRTPSAAVAPQPLSEQASSPGEEPATEKPSSTAAARDAVIRPDEVPWLSSLPASYRNRLPVLVVNIHVFAEDEAQRILYINNRPYKRGEQISGGVVVEAIVPDGVVLRAFGQRFKLPRPT